MVLPAALLFSLGLLLVIPVYTCGACGRGSIHFGRRKAHCPNCQTKYDERKGTIFRLFRGRRRLLMEVPIAILVFFLGSLRLLCLPVLVFHIIVGMFAPAGKRHRWLNCTAVLFLVLVSAPIDIEVGGFHGPHFGTPRKGPRLVRLVKGMPMLDRCVEKYGEFISGGCVVTGNEPAWLLVWEEAGLTAWTTKARQVAAPK